MVEKQQIPHYINCFYIKSIRYKTVKICFDNKENEKIML